MNMGHVLRHLKIEVLSPVPGAKQFPFFHPYALVLFQYFVELN